MKKHFASLLCYTLILPFCVSAKEAPSSERKLSRTQLTRQARSAKGKDKRSPEKNEVKSQKESALLADNNDRIKRSPQKAQNTSYKTRYSSKRRPILLAEADEEDDEALDNTSVEMSPCEKEPNRFRFSFVHREGKGIGYDMGYSSLDMFFAFTTIHGVTPFFDIRGHVTNDGKPAANAGFGLRYLPKTMNVVFGVNTFFDFRDARHSSFEQIGVGIEILGTQWKYGANGYFPIIKRDEIYDARFYKFSGHSVLVNLFHETAMPGFDTSIARSLIHRGFFDLDAYLGGYYFYGRQDLSATGGYLKFRSNLSRFCTLEVQGSYDTLFKWIAQGAAAINVPLGKRVKTTGKKRTCYERIALTRNITDPVSRFEMIVTHSNTEVVQGLDPRTGKPLSIVFVNNTQTDGDGTAEAPYGRLDKAELNSLAGQMIYVYAGDGTDNKMDTGIILKDSQWLQGSGISFNVLTKEELVTVPAQTASTPYISAILFGPQNNRAVTLGNNNTVNGLRLKSNYQTIYADNKVNGNITNNLIQDSGSGVIGIDLNNISGTWNITSNTVTTSIGAYIESDQVSIINILLNTFQNGGNNNLEVLINGAGESNITAKKNTFANSTKGVEIVMEDTANGLVRMTDNTFSNIHGGDSESALTVSSIDSSNLTALLARNTLNVSSGIGMAAISDGSSNAFFVLQGNNSSTSSSFASSIGITVSSLGSSTTTASLSGNSASGVGPIFLSQDNSSTYYLESPTLSLTGVQNLNPGTIQTSGTINYIPYNPPVIK